MADSKQIPHLLRLLDDESDVVRKAVLNEFASFGDTLPDELDRLSEPLDEQQRRLLFDLLEDHQWEGFRRSWSQWYTLIEDKEKLETAQSLIAEIQNPQVYKDSLTPLLDVLTEEFNATDMEKDALGLSKFLFKTKRFIGARSDYYNPLNSNLVYTLREKRGLPISLACIYILVGYRLGLDIEGVNFPGHFLTRIVVFDQVLLVDCFNGGKLLQEKEVAPKDMTSLDLDKMVVSAEEIIARVLRNLIRAYELEGNGKKMRIMMEILKDLEQNRL